MLTTRIAFRNVFRNRRRSAITLLVIVFGAVGLILFGGYKQQTFRGLRESTIRSRLGHLQIYKRGFATNEAKKPLELGLDNVAELRRAVESDKRVKMTATQITLNWFENAGFCGPGEAGDFIEQHWDEKTNRILIDGRIPVNPHGGALSEGATQGSGHLREAGVGVTHPCSNLLR